MILITKFDAASDPPQLELDDGGNPDKTLVAWVTIKGLDQKGGSVLTLQYGYQFDAIVYGERARRRWMAGSDRFLRTQDFQIANAMEGASSDELIQIAIVYEGYRISIYRNCDLYTSYMTQTRERRLHKSLTEGDGYLAVFGLQHIGAAPGTGFVGTIEDARIYDQALSGEQLCALKPNEESTIEPMAWWNFEGEEVVDRAGRFTHHGMTEGASIENGRLRLNGTGYLVAALSKEDALRATDQENPQAPVPSYEPETPAWPSDPPDDWLTFHLAHPGPGVGRPADPNAAFYYKGRYHLHYMYRNHIGYVYGHVSSDDMVHWHWHPTVLTPARTGHGVWSGTGFFKKDGTPAIIYHGQDTGRNWISVALDDQLNSWSDPKAVVALDKYGLELDIRHWDPDLFLMDGKYYAVSGGRNPQLMKSDDLENWVYLGDLLHPDFPTDLRVPKDEDISCPNIFNIGSKWMLLCISHELGCRYYLGDFKDGKFLPGSHHLMSFGNNAFFAPHSLLTRDGRRVMWAYLWSGGITERFANLPIKPSGVQSLPRELELPDDGVLRIRPLRELKALRYEPIRRERFTISEGQNVFLEEIRGDALEIELTFAWPLPEEFGIDLLADERGKDGMRIATGENRKTISVGTTEVPFMLKEGENLTLRVFVDKNLIEVFINDRQAAVYATQYIRENPNIHIYTQGGELTVKSLKAWKMKSIYAK